MSENDLLMLLQADLNILRPDLTRNNQLRHLIRTAIQMIRREGATLAEPYSAEDGQLIIMYASYLFRKRATDEPMPRMLRWALNNRIFSEKARAADAT